MTRHHGLTRVINDWEVGVPGFFGTNKPTTLTAYLVKGTAPGIVTGHEADLQRHARDVHDRGLKPGTFRPSSRPTAGEAAGLPRPPASQQ